MARSDPVIIALEKNPRNRDNWTGGGCGNYFRDYFATRPYLETTAYPKV